MIPWVELDSAEAPGGKERLRLKQRGTEFSIMLGANELMNSRLSGSEEALATLTQERLADVARPSILIGGLGMGFTLRAALAVSPKDARIDVVELVPSVVRWARGPMAELHAGSLDDPRVTIVESDVAKIIARANAAYDAILLDVDNGPKGLTVEANDALYSHRGLAAARAALKPNGILAVWSQGPDARFAARLRQSGFEVEEMRVRASRSKRGARHIIWLAKTPA
ncbi:MAG: spermidine synthase [Aliihoeflea sp.]|uniref:spermidine synthase n=1 Tax=Aliihoeflea sp. TaxID=2608088 RepID=UPI004033E02C